MLDYALRVYNLLSPLCLRRHLRPLRFVLAAIASALYWCFLPHYADEPRQPRNYWARFRRCAVRACCRFSIVKYITSSFIDATFRDAPHFRRHVFSFIWASIYHAKLSTSRRAILLHLLIEIDAHSQGVPFSPTLMMPLFAARLFFERCASL